jgi:sulfonate transport system ATP-binding protein
MAGVEVTKLTKCYRIGNHEFAALADIDLTLADGSFTTIVGRSGCGKTTLLRLLCGLETPTSGRIAFTARDDAPGTLQGRVGIVFQEPRLMPWLTVAQNIAFSQLDHPNREALRESVVRILRMLGLERFRNAYPAQISGGMAQRVALGRTLCYDPDLILMDEPFGALDFFTRKRLQNEIIDLFLSEGKTCLLVTHDVEEAIYLGQQVIVLDAGRLVQRIVVGLPYRRKRSSASFLEIQETILGAIHEPGDPAGTEGAAEAPVQGHCQPGPAGSGPKGP